jgi:hypothetical protein
MSWMKSRSYSFQATRNLSSVPAKSAVHALHISSRCIYIA